MQRQIELIGAAWGLMLYQADQLGYAPGSVGFNQMMAAAIAQTIFAIILTVIALALVALLFRSGDSVGVQPQAFAQTNVSTPPTVKLAKINDIVVKNFKEVILLGDGKTFRVRVDDGIGVYQVQEY